MSIFQSRGFAPSCILAGVALVLLVLASALPPGQIFALSCGSAVAVGLVLARLRREAAEDGEPVSRIAANG